MITTMFNRSCKAEMKAKELMVDYLEACQEYWFDIGISNVEKMTADERRRVGEAVKALTQPLIDEYNIHKNGSA